MWWKEKSLEAGWKVLFNSLRESTEDKYCQERGKSHTRYSAYSIKNLIYMWLTHDITHRTAFVICEIRSVIDSKPSHECLRANVQAEMVNQTRESTNSKLCGWSTGKLFPFHLGDPENQVRVRSSARLLSSGVWPGHWRTLCFEELSGRFCSLLWLIHLQCEAPSHQFCSIRLNLSSGPVHFSSSCYFC